mgnify:CR=1 FL=1
MIENRKKLVSILAQARKEKKISQRKLAQLTGLPQAYICRVENGVFSVGIDVLIKICDAIGKKIEIVDK